MQDDCLINNTDRTFWAWLLRFSFITGKPLFTTLSSVTSPKPLSQQFVRRADICERCTRNSNSLNIPFFKNQECNTATGQRTYFTVVSSFYGTNFERKLKDSPKKLHLQSVSKLIGTPTVYA